MLTPRGRQFHYPEKTKFYHSDFTLKALTFLVGVLTSMTLTESLGRHPLRAAASGV